MTTIIRASSLPTYGDCSRMWAARTLWKEVTGAGYQLQSNMRNSIGAGVGTATHGGAAYIMTEKMNTGEIGNQTEAEQRALSDLETATSEGVIWDTETANLNDAQKQVVRMIKVFRATLAVELIPIAVERRLECGLGDDFILSGQSDMQLVSPHGIDDLKTGRIARMHYPQLGSYSLLARTAHPDIEVKSLRSQFIQRVRPEKEQPLPVTEEYDQVVAEQAAMGAIRRIKQDVAEFRRRLQDGDAPPEHSFLANPSSMLCSEKYCAAYGSDFCREHKKPKPTTN